MNAVVDPFARAISLGFHFMVCLASGMRVCFQYAILDLCPRTDCAAGIGGGRQAGMAQLAIYRFAPPGREEERKPRSLAVWNLVGGDRMPAFLPVKQAAVQGSIERLIFHGFYTASSGF